MAPSKAMQGAISGLFHIANASNLKLILTTRLLPGHKIPRAIKAGRIDLHFTAFSAFGEERGPGRLDAMTARLTQARSENVSLAQIALNVENVWPDMRLCITNGYFLCNDCIHPRSFESITVYTWRADLKRWVGRWLYNTKMERMIVTHFVGKRAYDARRIAEVLASTESDADTRNLKVERIQQEVEDSEVAMKQYLREAQRSPLSMKDIEIWKDLPCRRGPSCLLSNPAACAECLTCGVMYGTKVTKEAVQESPAAMTREDEPMIDPDDDDGEREVTWDEEHSLPPIEPTRPEGEYGLPSCDIEEMMGRRNRVFCVRGHPWTNY